MIDGSATGPIAAEIINWTGQVVLVPRSELHELAGREQLRGTGIYILVGPSEHGDADRVYPGEADSVYWRLKEHDKEKDFWTRAVAITSKDMNLTKAHGRYLESRLIQMAPAEPGFLRFTEDVEFTSPSAAASTVVGGNRNGRETWVTKAGETYGTFKQRQIEAAEAKR
ncbi:MAG: GIY-YIG nuclease family protein [Phycisphaeraceae bacterium]|nr:GIY-YIG nuclease family protein [Phycisphaeraceae bacterium]